VFVPQCLSTGVRQTALQCTVYTHRCDNASFSQQYYPDTDEPWWAISIHAVKPPQWLRSIWEKPLIEINILFSTLEKLQAAAW